MMISEGEMRASSSRRWAGSENSAMMNSPVVWSMAARPWEDLILERAAR